MPPGLAAFGALRAEDEPWLLNCYVPPAEFALMSGPRSTLLFGEVGSGKSAARRALTQIWEKGNGDNGWLIAVWPVNALLGVGGDLTGSILANRQQAQIFDAVARVLLMRLGASPNIWNAAPDWARVTLTWFVKDYFQGNLETYIAALIDQETVPRPEVLHAFLERKQSQVLAPTAPPATVIDQLTRALSRLGFQGIRILVENIEPWWEVYASELSRSLSDFLSTLSLFEHPNFVYTMFLPTEMAPHLIRSSSVVRRRVQAFTLRFSHLECMTVVDRRIALALGRQRFDLAELGPVEVLKTWLIGCGGDSPRGWLEAVRPFFATYLGTNSGQGHRALTTAECRKVQQRHPPILELVPGGQVRVGWRRVNDLSAGHMAILRYLYDHMGQVCSRKDLYKVYVEAAPGGQVEADAKPLEYAGILDSAIWRLRAIIETRPSGSGAPGNTEGAWCAVVHPVRFW